MCKIKTYFIFNTVIDYQKLPNCIIHPTGVVLGRGAYSKVLEVEYRNKLYAAKKYRMDEQVREALCREQEILTRTRHPNIVSYYGICKLESDKSTVLVMERMDKNLTTYLNDCESTLSVNQILHDIAKGLHHLHSRTPAIIHRDLTAGNVLLNSNGVAKISDFGNSRIVDLYATPELLTSRPGTLDYMPPEALEKSKYNDKLDIFSYGHLAIHIVIKRRPYPLLRATYTEAGSLIARNEAERRKEFLKEVSEVLDGGVRHSLYVMIVKCLENESKNRPSCEEIISNGIRNGIFKKES